MGRPKLEDAVLLPAFRLRHPTDGSAPLTIRQIAAVLGMSSTGTSYRLGLAEARFLPAHQRRGVTRLRLSATDLADLAGAVDGLIDEGFSRGTDAEMARFRRLRARLRLALHQTGG